MQYDEHRCNRWADCNKNRTAALGCLRSVNKKTHFHDRYGSIKINKKSRKCASRGNKFNEKKKNNKFIIKLNSCIFSFLSTEFPMEFKYIFDKSLSPLHFLFCFYFQFDTNISRWSLQIIKLIHLTCKNRRKKNQLISLFVFI